MRSPIASWLGALLVCAPIGLSPLAAQQTLEPQEIPGERVPASAISPLVLESMDVVRERERNAVYDDRVRGVWNGEDGRWFVPSYGVTLATHSGAVAVVNEWGDPRIGIRFGRPVDVDSVWLAGHGTLPAPSLIVVGYREGLEVARTARIPLDGGAARAVDLALPHVDRIEFVAETGASPMGFFALDDLSFRAHGAPPATATVLDFEDLDRRAVLTGSRYAGLVWETGTGLRGVSRDGMRAVSPPQTPRGDAALPGVDEPLALGLGGGGTAPSVSGDFVGPRQGDPGGGWIPPDTCGAVGPDHFLSVTNANLSAWRKDTGQRVFNVGLNSFFGQTVGDPRAAWDHHAQRYVVMATDFTRSRTIYFGVSQTADPNGSWYKFSFRTDQGSDAGRWPDYPTLGLDQNGLYTAAYMVGSGARMTIWAVDKTNLQGPTPTTPTITAFRSLPWEGAIQPCMTYDTTAPQYLASRAGSTSLRLRQLTWSGTTPQLVDLGLVGIPSHGSPPNAPALGSATPLSTIDARPMNAVFRNGSVWTVHNVGAAGKAAVRWYEIDATARSTVQVGTITDPVWHYFYGSIAVDARGDVALGFSGSHSGAYATAFVTGRLAGDPPGETAPPVQIKAGEAGYERTDSSGRNRWGDYSLTSVDPVDDLGFWSIQEYARTGNSWGTWITQLGYERIPYGDGLAGTNGVPALAALDRPELGATMRLQVDNSTGAGTTPGVLMVGIAKAAQPVLGGTVLVQPFISADLAITAPALVVPILVPNDPGLIGTDVFFQAVQADTGAVQGVSFTPGLEIRPVTR